MNRENLFDDDFNFGHKMGKGREKVRIADVRPFLTEFKEHLSQLLQDLYNPAIPFSQTTREENCVFCSYNEICRRQGN